MNEHEGTIDDNDQGPWFKSGDDHGAMAHGFAITCKLSGRYDQSPTRTNDRTGIAAAIVASRTSKAAWVLWYQANWSAMFNWLDALDAADLDACFTLAREADAVAALL